MKTRTRIFGGWGYWVGVLALMMAGATDERGVGRAAERPPWNTTRVKGAPDPAPPYKAERVFPRLTFRNPVLLANAPATDRLFVAEQAGKIFSFLPQPDPERADLFADFTQGLPSVSAHAEAAGVDALYGLVFHPRFQENRYCYVCYVLRGKRWGEALPEGSRVSRFRVSNTEPPRLKMDSEQILLTFLAGGHNGGCLQFGPDGCLYVSTGDAANPNPPDVLNTGQDCGDLLSSILRLDVDRADAGKNYGIPKDNPFVHLPKVRPEIWAFGFRNPWRMSFDRATGDLWVGDVGWELWEMVYRVQRGGNYGWPIMEGRQSIRPEVALGPSPVQPVAISPPTLDYPHTHAASITGGNVYRGQRLPELHGAYICGDWETRRIWGAKFQGEKLEWHKELAVGDVRVVAFGEDNAGELYLVHYDDAGSLHKLVPNKQPEYDPTLFPRRLSETGLFTDTAKQIPAAGVVPFAIHAARWTDFATATRWVALPGQGTARFHAEPMGIPGSMFSTTNTFPKDSVLAKTFSLEMQRGDVNSKRNVETQLLHYDGMGWRGYSYRWNEAQTDAELVPATGADLEFTVDDAQAPNGQRRQTWHYPSRAECLQCHNPWSNYALALNVPQLHGRASKQDNSPRTDELTRLRSLGIISLEGPWGKELPRLYDHGDSGQPLEALARSYLHVNCSHCHQFGAGGSVTIQLRHDTALRQTQTLDVRPVQGTFGIPDGRIIAASAPYRSVLLYRMAKLGRGRMPHLGSTLVDDAGVALLHDWISQLPTHHDDLHLVEELRQADEDDSLARERDGKKYRLERLALERARSQQRAVTADDRRHAEKTWADETRAAVTRRRQQRERVLNQLLADPSHAMVLARSLDKTFPKQVRAQALKTAMNHPDAAVRDLFETFVPVAQRPRRLGTTINTSQLLALPGDATRGKALFLQSNTLQCRQCHQYQGTGGKVGPDLTAIGKKLTRVQLLENLLQPSKNMEPKYVPHLLVLADGRTLTGVMLEQTPTHITLRDARDQEIRVSRAEMEAIKPLTTSLMPDQLLRDLTAQQAADLLRFLTDAK